MNALIAALAAATLTALLAVAYLYGRHTEHQHNAADWQLLRAELDATYADLISIPDWPENTAHQQEIAIQHRTVQAEPRLRLDLRYGGAA